LRGIYRVRCGSGSCTFLTFGFGFGSVFGKTLILILFVFAGFGFFHISLYSLVYSESWSLKDGHRHIKMPKNILNLTPKPITHAPPHRFNLSTAGIVPKLFHPLVGGSPEFFLTIRAFTKFQWELSQRGRKYFRGKFGDFRPKSPFIWETYKTGPRLLWITNRKS